MYILNIAKAIKKMSANEIRDFIFENYYKRIGFFKEYKYYSMKHLKKIFVVACKQINRKKKLDLCSAKEHHQSFIRKKKHKISKAIKNNYLSTKNF